MEQLQSELSRCQKIQRMLEVKLSTVSEQLAEKSAEIQAKNAEISGQRLELNDQHNKIQDLLLQQQRQVGSIRYKNNEKTALSDSLASKEEWISRVKHEVSSLAIVTDARELSRLVERLNQLVNPIQASNDSQIKITASKQAFHHMSLVNRKLGVVTACADQDEENHRKALYKLTKDNSFLIEELNRLRKQLADQEDPISIRSKSAIRPIRSPPVPTKR